MNAIKVVAFFVAVVVASFLAMGVPSTATATDSPLSVDVLVKIDGKAVTFPFGIRFEQGDKAVGGTTATNGHVMVQFPNTGAWVVKHDHPCNKTEPGTVEVTAETNALVIEITCK